MNLSDISMTNIMSKFLSTLPSISKLTHFNLFFYNNFTTIYLTQQKSRPISQCLSVPQRVEKKRILR